MMASNTLLKQMDWYVLYSHQSKKLQITALWPAESALCIFLGQRRDPGSQSGLRKSDVHLLFAAEDKYKTASFQKLPLNNPPTPLPKRIRTKGAYNFITKMFEIQEIKDIPEDKYQTTASFQKVPLNNPPTPTQSTQRGRGTSMTTPRSGAC